MQTEEASEKTILYLDDEVENLESFSLYFMEYYNILTTSNAAEAETLLQENDVQVVITDQRMPDVTGVEFLKKIRPIYPQMVCMIVSGYSDTEVVIKAVNEAEIYQFIVKPWDVDAFKMAIDNAFEKYHLTLRNKHLIEDLQHTNQLLANKIAQLDTYIYRASHDIKGYITRFMGLCLTGKVEFQDSDVTIHEYFQRMYREAQNMSKTLQNHILLNMVETNTPTFETFYFKEILSKAAHKIEEYEGVSSTQRIDVQLEDTSLQCYSDSTFLEAILFHILHNAVVFSSQKRIVLSANFKNQTLHLCVLDEGIGIESELCTTRIYERFYRGTPLSTGNGLGLYIVKVALEKLNGSIQITSELQKGTKVEIQLPMALQKQL